MNRSLRLAITLLTVVSLLSVVPASRAADGGGGAGGQARSDKHVPDEILVRFAHGVPSGVKAAVHAGFGARAVARYATVDGLHLVKLPKGVSVKEAIKLYQRRADVLYAEPNYIVHALAPPNDTSFTSLWGLENTGQTSGTPDADIDAVSAWGLATGSSNVVVAVIDTGVDYTHPDLTNNMFRNTVDCNTNGIDDDGNGFIDDCYGLDVVNGDRDPMDDHFHGTHVSGTIGAEGNNGLGVVGVNWDVQLMACKFLDSGGSGTTDGAVACLNYVAMMKDRGVNVVATNNSWGGGGFSQALYDAINAHRQRGILFMAAAGNSGLDNDTALFYPASYYLPNVISVAATTETDGLASFSNYGRRTVHLGAPGTNILSTMPGNTYGSLSGTSMATPHVTGVAALLKAQDPSRDWRAIRNLILAGGDDKVSLTNTVTGKRLNAYGALACSGATVLSRLQPIGTAITGAVGTPVDLAALNINCASPNGPVTVTVASGAQTVATVVLQDDGVGPDLAAGDGIYSGQWTPATPGTYTLAFPDGDAATVTVLAPYTYTPVALSYRTITGSNLNLTDDSSALITPPFPIRFGGGSFTSVSVNSNGTLSFTGPFTEYTNTSLPTPGIGAMVAVLWDDLFPVLDQNVYWAVTGVAPNRELVIEWRDVRLYLCNPDSTATVRFQVVLFESSSNVLMNYADTAFGGLCSFADDGASATVGIQVSQSQATQYSVNMPYVTVASALRWTLVTPPPSPPAISVTPASQAFGTVIVGSSADLSFTVQNAGGGTLTGNASTAAPYAVISGGSFNLGAGASQQVTVRFTPTASGSAPGQVSFTSNAGDVLRSVTGTGALPPAISVTPASQAFGTVIVGSSADLSFTVQNAGGGTLTGNASTAAPYAVISGGSFNLGAGASQQVTVRFTPTASGSAPGQVSFTSNGGNPSRPVTGIGTAPPVLTVTPSSLAFGTIKLGATKDNHFTVKNTGVGTLTGSASTSPPFSITSGGSFSLGPGASRQVNVRFTPATPGASVTGTVSFTSNGGNAARSVTGTAPPASITVTSPNGGEIWSIGVNKTIKWTFSGLSGNVRIDLSRDGGATWVSLFGSTSNDKSQQWTVTGPPSTQARIRVCDVTQAVCDTSDGAFTIP